MAQLRWCICLLQCAVEALPSAHDALHIQVVDHPYANSEVDRGPDLGAEHRQEEIDYCEEAYLALDGASGPAALQQAFVFFANLKEAKSDVAVGEREGAVEVGYVRSLEAQVNIGIVVQGMPAGRE